MQLNIFRIPVLNMAEVRTRLRQAGMTITHSGDQAGWTGEFFFAADPKPTEIPWVKTFARQIGSDNYENVTYFAVFLFTSHQAVFAITFGKAHFFIRPFCDYDFGTDLAKRLADENEVAQTSGRRYAGKQRKDIRSFVSQARLNIPPGESLDFMEAQIAPGLTQDFGAKAKFGSSARFSVDISPDGIGKFLSKVAERLSQPEQFKLPRTTYLTNEEEISRHDENLRRELLSPVGTSEFSVNSHDLFGVDFVFSSAGSFTMKCGHYKALNIEQLAIREVKEYIRDRKIPEQKVLDIKITHHREDGPDFTQTIKQALDYINDRDRVILSGGRWLQFNQDYLDFLDEAVDEISREDVEPELQVISVTEPEFNAAVESRGYAVADKNFEIFRTRSKTPIEAWDLAKEETVYAVKFGTPQKLNYVVDQAATVLEILHNRANAREVPNFNAYCLWLGYRAKSLPERMSGTGSIILKQKLESWARRCVDLGIEPKIKLSLRQKPGIQPED